MIGLTVLVLLYGGVSAASHWYRYFYTSVSGVSDFPQFVAVGYLDDKELNYYDSWMKTIEPRHRVMELAADAEFYRRNTEVARGAEKIDKVNIDNNRKRSNQSGGIHTWQTMYGCELREDGNSSGFAQYGWNGKDFINFDKKNMVWVTPVTWGEITKSKWDQNKEGNKKLKNYLEERCIAWLKRYLQIGEKELRPVSPSVSFTRRGDSNRLSCVTTGFYPQAIEVTLRRDGVSLNETHSDGILPNHDGTYQIHKWTDIDPADQAKFSCEVDHSGLKEKMVAFYERKSVSLLPIIVGVLVVAVLLIIAVIVGVVIHKKKVEDEKRMTDCPRKLLLDQRQELNKINQGRRPAIIKRR
ncbi:class I histocompatibility antigen, F10 alpha chain-like [Heterodontus francisci]|uniref:class I histocompatibility antigen, F10 alpha chain-like n=1 Tax=Heterodontus francisci TaxID=7792 RepID=UPI00355B219C